jgi:hypothetical protein
MKILRPVPVNVRMPEIRSGSDNSFNFVVEDDYGFKNYAHYSSANEDWINDEAQVISDVILWYEEVEIESLFPDDDKIYNAGMNATNKQHVKTMFFQEGASYFKNFIIKMLKK